jgi:hypothetical protein
MIEDGLEHEERKFGVGMKWTRCSFKILYGDAFTVLVPVYMELEP